MKNNQLQFTKRFFAWSKLKQLIQDRKEIPAGYKERDVWWISLGHNVGDEEDGKNMNFSRPILIVKGFSKNLIWGVPLSTTKRRGTYYYPVRVNDGISTALLSQLRAIDTRRFISKYGMVSQKDFEEVKYKLRDLLR
jgi:mRNA interferase MazF